MIVSTAQDNTFQALADPTRRSILQFLAKGEATVLEIAALFEISQPAITRHLGVLEKAGLILRRIDGARRPCRLAPQSLDLAEKWISELKSTMESNYQRLDALLEAQNKKEQNTGISQ